MDDGRTLVDVQFAVYQREVLVRDRGEDGWCRAGYSRIDPERLRRYVDAHPDAVLRQIAERFNYNVCSLKGVIERHNIAYVKKQCGRKPAEKSLSAEKLSAYVRKHPDDNQRQIAAYFGCDSSKVSVALRKYNILYEKHYYAKIDQDQVAKVEGYVRENPFIGTGEISQFTGISEGHVRYIMRRYGIRGRQDTWQAEAIMAYAGSRPGVLKKEMAQYFGVNLATFCRRLKKYAISF